MLGDNNAVVLSSTIPSSHGRTGIIDVNRRTTLEFDHRDDYDPNVPEVTEMEVSEYVRHLWMEEEKSRHSKGDHLAMDVAGHCMLSPCPLAAWKDFQIRVEARIQLAKNHHRSGVAYQAPIDEDGRVMSAAAEDHRNQLLWERQKKDNSPALNEFLAGSSYGK